MTPDAENSLVIAGAGLAGALLATLLAQRGWSVDVYEKRPDPRRYPEQAGRSINLALAERGLHALRQAGLAETVLTHAVMMRGRMVHFATGDCQLQRYGRDDSEVIWSVHRGQLNRILTEAAEQAGVRLHFGQRVAAMDTATRQLQIESADGARTIQPFTRLIGADGAGSAVRAALVESGHARERWEPLGHSYKELEIPPAADGGFCIEPHALHIWPRGRYMCIALPNSEHSFTVTLFLPNEGEPSFASLASVADARRLFERDFADVLPLIPTFDRDFAAHPIGWLATLYTDCWHLDERIALVGDAAHAMVPFHGQGMNCAFEDCVELAGQIETSAAWGEAFSRYETSRRPNAEAIQAMALENYLEMRDRVDDRDFLLQRALELLLAERHPARFIPRYSMVTFRRMPYAAARARGEIQRALLIELTQGRQRIGDIDLANADRLVQERLPPF